MKPIELIQSVEECPICRKWILFCLIAPESRVKRGGLKQVEPVESVDIIDWYRDKAKFWSENAEYLIGKGFEFNLDTNLSRALDFVETLKIDVPDQSKSLIIFKIGSNDRPASPSDIEAAHECFNNVTKGMKCRIIVTHHYWDITKIEGEKCSDCNICDNPTDKDRANCKL